MERRVIDEKTENSFVARYFLGVKSFERAGMSIAYLPQGPGDKTGCGLEGARTSVWGPRRRRLKGTAVTWRDAPSAVPLRRVRQQRWAGR